MAGTLDRSRPFGTVTGDAEGRAYEQDHHFYRADGSVWSAPTDLQPGEVEFPAKPTPKKKAAAAASEPAPAAVDAQLDAQMGAA
jgi:hypothetical protein